MPHSQQASYTSISAQVPEDMHELSYARYHVHEGLKTCVSDVQAAVAAYMQYLLTLTPAQLAVLANQMVPQQQPVGTLACVADPPYAVSMMMST